MTSIPRILITGLRGGGGKTLVSLGLAAAWQKRGYNVAPFKKGPDYIDAAWLSMAANKPCRNLDPFLMDSQTLSHSFTTWTTQADVALIEGNRGLFDGMNAQGTYSTATVAKLLKAPVIIVADCTKSTRTVAATILGCQKLDPAVSIVGVVLNQTAGPRHDSVLREAIELICGLPVLGAVARIPQQIFPERHLGLVPPDEHDQQAHSIRQVTNIAEKSLDLDAIEKLARQAPPLEFEDQSQAVCNRVKLETVRIGVCRDTAFQFYYPDNLEALAKEGANVVEISPLHDHCLPELDALYIGGGFPETMAPALSKNQPFIKSLRQQIEKGLPVYAECGGAVYLGEKLLFEQKQYPMANVLPVSFVFHTKAMGHGYAVLETVAENPFYSVGNLIRGHEFHYTCIDSADANDLKFAFRVRRGYGFDGQRDGLCQGNVLACYTHVHALGVESWAPALCQAAICFKQGRKQSAP